MYHLGTACKSRWKNIRDQFRRHVSRKQTTSGQAAENTKKYKYEDYLQFLLPYIGERQTVSNVKSPGCNNSQDNDTDELCENSHPVTETEQTSTAAQVKETAQSSQTAVKEIHKHKPMKRKYASESPSSILMKYILEKNSANRQNDQSDIDTFLTSIRATLKKFSPYYLHLAKGRIFNIVHELDFQQLQNSAQPQSSQNNSPWPSPSASTIQNDSPWPTPTASPSQNTNVQEGSQ